MSDPILLSVDDGLATLTLNRPERLNAFNADMARAWERVTIEVTGRGDVGAIVLAGAGSSFCAGGDVAEMATSLCGAEAGAALAQTINAGSLALP